MNNSEETLKQSPQTDAILQAIAELSKKTDDYKKQSDIQIEIIRQRFDAVDSQFEIVRQRFDAVDTQLEAIRQGIVHNSVS